MSIEKLQLNLLSEILDVNDEFDYFKYLKDVLELVYNVPEVEYPSLLTLTLDTIIKEYGVTESEPDEKSPEQKILDDIFLKSNLTLNGDDTQQAKPDAYAYITAVGNAFIANNYCTLANSDNELEVLQTLAQVVILADSLHANDYTLAEALDIIIY